MANKTLTPETHAVQEGKEKAARGRNSLLIGGLVGVALIQGVALVSMLPLKERIPYYLEVEQATGRVVPTSNVAKSFIPDENNKRYFLKEWVAAMFSIDQLRSRDILLPKAKSMSRGKAIGHYTGWLSRDKTIERMIEKPELTRVVQVKSISFVPGAENVAIIRATFRTEGVAGEALEEGKVITLSYAIVPPQTDEEILRNPIGLFITEFNVDSEVIQ